MAQSILTEILERKQEEIAALTKQFSGAEIKARAEQAPPARDFRAALASGKPPRVIAEIKKASPSKGVIAERFEPAPTGRRYEEGGAAAISVLTDERFFQGKLSHLTAVKNETSIPVLRKDFLIHPHQIYESRAAGADSVLLIAAALKNAESIAELLEIARSVGMEPLVEVHKHSEVEMALKAGARVIGINNRDLESFEVDLSVSETLAPAIGKDKVIVAESGITSSNDMLLLSRTGVSAFLIGESFMKSASPGKALSDMIRGWAQ